MNTTSTSMELRSGAFILLETLPTPIALPATHVLGISRAKDSELQDPCPLTDLFPISFSALVPVWVLKVSGGGEATPVLYTGKVQMSYIPTDSLISMSSLKYGGFERFSHLVLANGQPLALVINMDAFFKCIAN